MTNQEILDIAIEQSSIDSSCYIDDFKITTNKVVISQKNQGARHYLELPFEVYECFETPKLHLLMESLKPFNMNVCFMEEYFLPDVIET